MSQKQTPSRLETLDSLVDAVLAEHRAWLEYPGDSPPGKKYWAAVDKLVAGFAKGEIPAGRRRLAVAVSELQVQVQNYVERDDAEEQSPKPQFFYAVEELERCRNKTKVNLPPLETVAELMAMPNMQLAQVARMYRWFLPNGEPDTAKVKRELANPGSECPPGYDPRVAELDAEDAEAGESPIFNEAHDAEEPDNKPCPETALELWEQEVSPEQAARMLRRPFDEVVKEFRKFDKEAKVKKQPASA